MTISSTTTRSTSSKSGGVTTRRITRTRNGKSSTTTLQTNSFKSMGGTTRNTVRISNPTPKAHKAKSVSPNRSPSNRPPPKRMSNSLAAPSSKSSYQRSNSNSTGSGGSELGILIILGLVAGAIWGIWEFVSWAYTSIKGKFQ